MPLIQMENVTKDYYLGKTVVRALRGVSLNINEGEFVAVWGPSGSGKTTLLNLMGAIDEPSSGNLSIRGQNILRLSDNDKSDLRIRHIGFVFQHFNLLPVLTALENVMLPLQIEGVSAGEARRRALERINQLGLADFIKHRPDKLSGGQQQRVAIARALVTNPSLIIADEPTGNLDSDTATSTIKLMRDLNRQEGTTFIFSTHDTRLLSHAERLIHLVDGKISANGYSQV